MTPHSSVKSHKSSQIRCQPSIGQSHPGFAWFRACSTTALFIPVNLVRVRRAKGGDNISVFWVRIGP